MRPLISIMLMITILGGYAAPSFISPRKGHIWVELPATSGATIGEVTLGTPQSGITEISIRKNSRIRFMVTPSSLKEVEQTFYELNATIQVFNENGEHVGTAQLQLVVNGNRNPERGINLVTLDSELSKGTYQAMLTVSYWTAAVTKSLTGWKNSFTIHVIPRATKK